MKNIINRENTNLSPFFKDTVRNTLRIMLKVNEKDYSNI